MSTWYLGPLGDLRELVCPEPDIKINPVRYGGVHQGLSGARIMDVTGHRDDYEFFFRMLGQDEYQWLDLLHSRVVPGPHWLINPLKKNRLSVAASRLVVTPYGKTGVRPPVGALHAVHPAFPAGQVGFVGRSVYFWRWTDQSPRITFDPGRPIPVRPGETLTGSFYVVQSGGTVTGSRMRFDWIGLSGEPVSPASTSGTFNLTGSTWARREFTATPPQGAVAGRFSMEIGTLSDPDDVAIFIAAPQVESGTGATDFEVGCAAPQVLIDQLETSSPRYPYRDVTLTLLEA